MRAYLLLATVLLGCGTEITLIGGDGLPEPPVIPPTPEQPPDVTPPPLLCGGSSKGVEVWIEDYADAAQCGYGSGSFDVIAIDPAPEYDGIRISAETCVGGGACACNIVVAGIGADIADQMQINGGSFDYVMEPNWFELTLPVDCDQCVSCSCPLPQPLLFAADAEWALPGGAEPPPRPLTIGQGVKTCEVTDAGCTAKTHRIEVVAQTIEGNPNVDSAPILIGSVQVDEGDTVKLQNLGAWARNIRSNGVDLYCLALTDYPGDAAWVVWHEVYPSL